MLSQVQANYPREFRAPPRWTEQHNRAFSTVCADKSLMKKQPSTAAKPKIQTFLPIAVLPLEDVNTPP
ncbi:hypothetical protein TWF481_006251 [Arthrobotrys musiformis]|uniref:Uncharacterized protein n=1 Tax=Arthrobotrys musiformis TaxID=47236 RepID=A0AAV9WGQ0_9PEZI